MFWFLLTRRTKKGGSKDPVVLERVRIPPPVFFRSIEPFSLAEQERLDASLSLLRQEDPSLQISVDADTGQVCFPWLLFSSYFPGKRL